MHVDLLVGDLASSTAAAVALGATPSGASSRRATAATRCSATPKATSSASSPRRTEPRSRSHPSGRILPVEVAQHAEERRVRCASSASGAAKKASVATAKNSAGDTPPYGSSGARVGAAAERGVGLGAHGDPAREAPPCSRAAACRRRRRRACRTCARTHGTPRCGRGPGSRVGKRLVPRDEDRAAPIVGLPEHRLGSVGHRAARRAGVHTAAHDRRREHDDRADFPVVRRCRARARAPRPRARSWCASSSSSAKPCAASQFLCRSSQSAMPARSSRSSAPKPFHATETLARRSVPVVGKALAPVEHCPVGRRLASGARARLQRHHVAVGMVEVAREQLVDVRGARRR